MVKAAEQGSEITSVTFTDGDENLIQDVAAYLNEHKSEQFVTLTANFIYNGSDVAYAFFEFTYQRSQGMNNFHMPASINVTLIDTLP